MRWWRRVRWWWARARVTAEMRADMREHIELEIEDRMRSGQTAAEARRTALRDFGSEDGWLEEGRAARGWARYDEVRQDVRYGVRTLRAAPTFAIAAVLTLALAIGANTAVFSVVSGVLLEPLGYPAPEQLVRVMDVRVDEPGPGRRTLSYANFADMAAGAQSWERAAAYDEWQVSLMFDGVAERFDGAIVDAAWFDVLGVQPALGRFFAAEDSAPGGPVRVVLSWGLWQDRFGGDSAVVGRTITTNGYDATVIGVAPRGLEDPGMSGSAFGAPVLWRSPAGYMVTNSRGSRSFAGLVRLRAGVSVVQAQREADVLQAQLVAQYPDENGRHAVRLVPLKDTIVGSVRGELYILLGAVALVLLIACANVANLLLFRASTRAREMSVRTAIGASRARLVRQLLVESLLLAASGAVLGVVLAWYGTTQLTAFLGTHLPRATSVGVDARMLLFVSTISTAAALIFGLFPALYASRTDAGDTLRMAGRAQAGTRQQARVRGLVVATGVALSVVVLIGAALLVRSLAHLERVDSGMRPDNVLTLTLITPPDYETESLTAYYDRLFERLGALAGVEHVAVTDVLPMSGSFNGGPFEIVGAPPVSTQERPNAELRAVSPAYFDALGIPLLRGRGIAAADGADAPPVVVISRAVAERYFRDRDPIGERIRTYDAERTIVGVVGDVSMFTLDQGAEPTVYFPNGEAPDWMRDDPVLIVRTSHEPAAALTALRAAIRGIDGRVPIANERTMRGIIDGTLVLPRFRTLLMALFALIAFTLAVVGIYGTVAYAVTRRAREFGIRAAVGATRRDILLLVLVDGLRPVLFGAAAGLLLAAGLTRIAAAMLFEVSAHDPATFVATPIVFGLLAALAALPSARRAARAAPLRALRED